MAIDNLAFQFTGAFFLFFCLYFHAGITFETAKARRRIAQRPDAAGIVTGERCVNGDLRWYFPGERLEIRHVPYETRFRWPGTICSLGRDYSNTSIPGALFEVSFQETEDTSFAAPARGSWVSDRATVSFHDILGIFESRTGIASVDEFLVYPAAAENVPTTTASGGGEAGKNASSWRRTDTFLDSRVYVRGDDPRRINWKQYARHGTLFVRIGEFHMPPEAAITVILDAAPFDAKPEWLKDAWTERLVSACSGFCADAIKSGRDVYLSVNGAKPERSTDLYVQEAVARAFFGPGQLPPFPQAAAGSALVIFGSSGRESTTRIVRALRRNEDKASVYLACPPGNVNMTGNREPLFRVVIDALSHFLFSGTDQKARDRESLAAYADMKMAVLALKKAGAVHVEIV